MTIPGSENPSKGLSGLINKQIMKIVLRAVLLTSMWFLSQLYSASQPHYSNYDRIMQRTGSLAREYPSLCSVFSIGKTMSGKEIMVIRIGSGDDSVKPGIAVAGGVEGHYMLGKELALGFAETLLKESSQPEINKLLGEVSFYVFPDVSPEASESYFQDLKYENSLNSRPVDDDRDFKNGEDPYEDLNNDGFITLVRVADPSGTYTEYTDDKRVMVPADLSKGEHGSFIVLTEGIDNDGDGKFNEDGPGGVSFNKNLTYNYEEFGAGAGLHPVSEPETKAVLDYLFDHYNIFAVFTFGPQDNLTQAARSGERLPSTLTASQIPAQGPTGRTGERRITSVQRSDETVLKLVSERYKEITGLKGSPPSRSAPGNFMDWAYYHYGRYSFSTPGWWYPAEKEKNPEAAFLKFAEENKIEDVFVPWTEIVHPGFPGKKTEAGGIKPFCMIVPPEDKIEELVSVHYKFIAEVAAMHPQLEFLDIKTEEAGENIYRVTLKVHNKGLFATCAEAGQNNMWVRLMRLSLETTKGQTLLSGQKVQRVERLNGGGVAEFSWLILGKGKINISAGAVNTGIIKTSADLK